MLIRTVLLATSEQRQPHRPHQTAWQAQIGLIDPDNANYRLQEKGVQGTVSPLMA